MATTATQPEVPSQFIFPPFDKESAWLTYPDFKIVSRLDGVPAIHDSVTYAQ